MAFVTACAALLRRGAKVYNCISGALVIEIF